MSSTHEHLEQAEHAQHATHSKFDKRVAISIAMVAAVLATVSMIAHRTHNDVLRLQNEASVKEVNASNGYAWYQATRVRQLTLEINRDALDLQPAPTDPAAAQKREKLVAGWNAKIDEYKADLKVRKDSADGDKNRAKELAKESHIKHAQGNRLDIAHLAVELGLVLCSIAVLTKRKAFWLSGIVSCALGIGITLSAFTVTAEHHEEHPTESH
ncbi:DUF4337 domain-containing protein [Zavarzinella formosa]|uniref:DUF4337 domain-containing protein n=1 Tax=Zavarzinella formosa TaxID=360055 RepID=UPI0012F7E7A9|nr:DUF4337 domain-containing protein [Zavarzinella formosa]